MDPDKDERHRPLKGGEVVLLQELLRRAVVLKTHATDVRSLRVADMDDGGMGSLRFASISPDPRYGRTLCEAWFRDADGVPVVVSLNVDQNDELFELDSWKVDFTARRSLPTSSAQIFEGPATMD